MAPSPARTKTEDPGDGTTSIRVGPRVDKESSGSLRERLLVDGAMTSAGGEIFGWRWVLQSGTKESPSWNEVERGFERGSQLMAGCLR